MKFYLAAFAIAQVAILISAQNWGDVAGTPHVSVDIAQNSAGPFLSVITNRTIITDPLTIRGIRATDRNGTAGTIRFINPVGGVGQTSVNLEITSAVGQGFSWRIDVFTSGAFAKSISMLLIAIACFFVKIMS